MFAGQILTAGRLCFSIQIVRIYFANNGWEQKLFGKYRIVLADRGPFAFYIVQRLGRAQNVFQQLSQAPAFRAGEQSIAAYRYAMQLEAKSFRLYEDIASKEQAPATKSLLLKIAAEEQKHFNILENICLFLEEPAQHPTWAESSDLTDIRQFDVADKS